MSYKQKFREIVFQLLYSIEVGKSEIKDVVPLLVEKLKVKEADVLLATEKVQSIIEKKDGIDKMIEKASRDYELSRIQNVELNILRLGIFEMLFDDNIPPKVAISESIRLAHKFTTPSGATFINAVMDNLYHD